MSCDHLGVGIGDLNVTLMPASVSLATCDRWCRRAVGSLEVSPSLGVVGVGDLGSVTLVPACRTLSGTWVAGCHLGAGVEIGSVERVAEGCT